MPFAKNPFFTGRDNVLRSLRCALAGTAVSSPAPFQVVSGLGGIGKTQLLIEYAYRYRWEYDAVFWVSADSEASLELGFSDAARLLGLPESNENDRSLAAAAARRWLERNCGWLLLVDGADYPEELPKSLPREQRGHTVISSRVQVFDALGLAATVEMTELSPDEAVEFLSNRIGRVLPGSERDAAAELAVELGFLPLALEQAGAYILRNRVGVEAYLERYIRSRLALLERAKPVWGDYRDSVATTWELSFERVRALSEASGDLLWLSAFLHPDSIPLALVAGWAEGLGPAIAGAFMAGHGGLTVDELLEPLMNYSLVRREPGQDHYRIHRLVQEVLERSMGLDQARAWVSKAVGAVDAAFPRSLDYSFWQQCERFYDQAVWVAQRAERSGFWTEAVARLLADTGCYAHKRGWYVEAEQLLEQSLRLRECSGDPEEWAVVARRLAEVLCEREELGRAESLLEGALRALQATERTEGTEIAAVYSAWAMVRAMSDDVPGAEAFAEHAVDICRSTGDTGEVQLALALAELAFYRTRRGKYAEAQPLLQKALAIQNLRMRPDHPDIAATLCSLGWLHALLGEHVKADPFVRAALRLREAALGENHPYTATAASQLASLRRVVGDYIEAERLACRVLAARERAFGSDHPLVGDALRALAELHYDRGQYNEAQGLATRALEISEKALGANHPKLVEFLNDLADLYEEQGKHAEAQQALERALNLSERTYGSAHPYLLPGLKGLAALRRKRGDTEGAVSLEHRAHTIREALIAPLSD